MKAMLACIMGANRSETWHLDSRVLCRRLSSAVRPFSNIIPKVIFPIYQFA
jgi:hypothetical protein